jgi:hypothetical protein
MALSTVVMMFSSGMMAHAQTLVPDTSTWKWLHPTDGVDPAKADEDFHQTFFKLDFDDSKWNTGADKPGPHGGFGYGEEGFEGVDMGTPEMFENRLSAYLRLKFTTYEDCENLILKCQRDDGIIVYLDGKEVVRDNMPRGRDKYDMVAEEIISGEGETMVHSFPISEKLAAGDHILAISLHNRGRGEDNSGSSDLRIAEISLSVKSEEPQQEKQEEQNE